VFIFYLKFMEIINVQGNILDYITDNDIINIVLSNGTSNLINDLIRYKYSSDKIEAIINNYLFEPNNEEYIKEFKELQSWRLESKCIAKKVIDYINQNKNN